MAFGTHPGPFRLFKKGIADQCGWLLAFALLGLVALALSLPRWRRAEGPWLRVREVRLLPAP